MSSKRIGIYALVEPRSDHPYHGRVRYVGLTKDMARRRRSHRGAIAGSQLGTWLRELRAARKPPTFRVLILCDASLLAYYEKRAIAAYRRAGVADLNTRPGGQCGARGWLGWEGGERQAIRQAIRARKSAVGRARIRAKTACQVPPQTNDLGPVVAPFWTESPNSILRFHGVENGLHHEK